jgi:hypothetical protein
MPRAAFRHADGTNVVLAVIVHELYLFRFRVKQLMRTGRRTPEPLFKEITLLRLHSFRVAGSAKLVVLEVVRRAAHVVFARQELTLPEYASSRINLEVPTNTALAPTRFLCGICYTRGSNQSLKRWPGPRI